VLAELFMVFLRSFQANSGRVPQIRQYFILAVCDLSDFKLP